MKGTTAIGKVLIFTFLAVSALGLVALSGSQAQALQSIGDLELTYLGHLEATVTADIVIGETNQGLRHNVYYQGRFTGDRVDGYMSGIDYMAEQTGQGFSDVDSRAIIRTDDNAYISVEITGFHYSDGVIVDSYTSFSSGHENYEWMNDTVFFGHGGVTSDNTIEIDYYYYDAN